MPQKEISPARRRAWHRLAVQADLRARGQDVLFKGPNGFRFPQGKYLSQDEIPEFRKYVAQKTKLSLEYSMTSSGIVHPEQLEMDYGNFPSPGDFECMRTHTIQAWKYGLDEGKIGIYFTPVDDSERLGKAYFKGVEFVPDLTGKMSPARDEELRHRLILTFVSYFNKDNVSSNIFPTISSEESQQSESA